MVDIQKIMSNILIQKFLLQMHKEQHNSLISA